MPFEKSFLFLQTKARTKKGRHPYFTEPKTMVNYICGRLRSRIRVVLAAFASMMVMQAAGATADSLTAVAKGWYPYYVSFLREGQRDSVERYAKDDIVPITFDLNSTEVKWSSRLKSITKTIIGITDDPRVTLSYVWVGGSASPEGDLKKNIALAGGRADALAQYLYTNTPLYGDLVQTRNLEENWEGFRQALLNDKSFPHADDILDIIKNVKDRDERKTAIKNIDGGRTWELAAEEIFPSLRSSKLVIVCEQERIVPMDLNVSRIDTVYVGCKACSCAVNVQCNTCSQEVCQVPEEQASTLLPPPCT